MRPTAGARRLNSPVAVVGAAAVYFGLVFATGFAFGTIRVLLIAPRSGELPAAALEMPVMLAASWLWCGLSLRMFEIESRLTGFTVGAAAFVMLMAAELAVSGLPFGRSQSEYVEAYATPAGAIGLAGQIAFAVFPLARAGRPRRR